jgi:Mrp family chromosome partitioning ATPase
LNHQKEVGVKLTQRHQEYQKLLADYEMSQKFKTECIAQLRQFNLKEGMSESPVKVVDAAHIPTKPAGLNKVHQAVSILLLGLLFSVAFIFVLERFSMEAQVPAQQSPKPMYIPVGMQPGMNWANMYGQPTYPMDMPFQASSPEQSDMAAMEMAGTSTDLSQILGQLNNIELGGDSFGNLAFSARCRIVHTDQSSSPAESFREIGSQLLSRFGNTQQNIVITGDSDQNGKTTCACNLALFLAQSGRKVLLIDANRNKPALHRVFTASKGTPGLSDVLEDVSLLDEALQSAQVENLMIIHNSIDDDRAVDHDISRLSSLNQELRQRFDWIIYDTASIVDEFAKEILQVVGKTLFVTTDTELSAQHAATEQIEICGALNLGFVHNSYCTSSSSLSQEQELTSKG